MSSSSAFAMSVVISGPGAHCYIPNVTSWTTAVLPQKYVEISQWPSKVYLSQQPSYYVTVSLGAMPTLANDIITVVLTNITWLNWNVRSFTLSRAHPSQLLQIVLKKRGDIQLAALLSISSNTGEFASVPANTAPIHVLSTMSQTATKTRTINKPFLLCGNVVSIPYNSEGYDDAQCALCSYGLNYDLEQCADASQCYCNGTKPQCEYQLPFKGCVATLNTTSNYTLQDCQSCLNNACNPACLSGNCVCSIAGGNDAGIQFMNAGQQNVTQASAAVPVAVIAAAVGGIAGAGLIGVAAFLVIKKQRALAAAAAAALAAKSSVAGNAMPSTTAAKAERLFHSRPVRNPLAPENDVFVEAVD
jgi:hypothetical protein